MNMIITDAILVYHSAFKETRARPDASIFYKWKEYLWIGIPGASMLCFEWWAFELLAIFSGYMGVA
jgi:hypothetical protein